MVKYLIFDSGSIINMTEHCMVSVFRDLNKVFQGEFLITDGVKYEIIDHPLKIKRFQWGAIRIQSLLDEEIVKLAEDEEIATSSEISKKTAEVLNLANTALLVDGKPVHLIERGEAEALALSVILTEKGIENAVVVDERTARMLCESPDNLESIMESKLEADIKVKKENLEIFQKIKILRSTELIYIAYKKSLIDHNKSKLEAMLYALKFGGCSVSEKEIQIMRKL